MINLEQKKLELAEKIFKELIQKNSYNQEANYYLAYIYYKQKTLEQ